MGCPQYNMIDQIKDALTIMDAAEMIGIHFRRKSGRVLSACCPFHNDKTPSFAIWPETNRWHCFSGLGCGSGDQIDLMSRYWEMPIKQTIERLATELNLQPKDADHGKQAIIQREREEEANLINEFKRQERELFEKLVRLEQFTDVKLSQIKTDEDLEKVGDLYLMRTEVAWALDTMQRKTLGEKVEGFSIGKAVLERWLGS